ncbi:late embryogenesis abundant protein At1g64065-like [Bidens hawaiensis]|uniref:late embryogenesis abundant protein At1g64065-like n=1 Tax=Bidens hawaiensis TaxID=980011 RepID=UPI00404A2879
MVDLRLYYLHTRICLIQCLLFLTYIHKKLLTKCTNQILQTTHTHRHMEDPESQTTRLTQPGPRSHDQQPYTTTMTPYKHHHQETNKTLVYILSTIVIISSILLLLSSIFLRVENPKLRLHTLSIQTFQLSTTNSTTSLNITMSTNLTLNNRNFGRYVFENCNMVLLYGNDTIGGGLISSGRVGVKRTASIGVVLRVSYGNLTVGNTTDVMEIVSYARMTGRVHVTKLVDRRRTIEMNCTISLNSTSRSFISSQCS